MMIKRKQEETKIDEKDMMKVKELVIYKAERSVYWTGKEQEMTTKEFDMLRLFAENPNRAFSREELLVAIWGEDYFGSDRAVDDLIKRIRKKVPDIPLEAVWGYGYRLRNSVGQV